MPDYRNKAADKNGFFAIAADVDQDAEGDEDEAEEEADDEAGGNEVVQEFLAGNMKDHAFYFCKVRATNRPGRLLIFISMINPLPPYDKQGGFVGVLGKVCPPNYG